jgi:hypothetical protein
MLLVYGTETPRRSRAETEALALIDRVETVRCARQARGARAISRRRRSSAAAFPGALIPAWLR